jgi:hypothetical protein
MTHDEIFAPLGMRSTIAGDVSHDPKNLATSYDYETPYSITRSTVFSQSTAVHAPGEGKGRVRLFL